MKSLYNEIAERHAQGFSANANWDHDGRLHVGVAYEFGRLAGDRKSPESPNIPVADKQDASTAGGSKAPDEKPPKPLPARHFTPGLEDYKCTKLRRNFVVWPSKPGSAAYRVGGGHFLETPVTSCGDKQPTTFHPCYGHTIVLHPDPDDDKRVRYLEAVVEGIQRRTIVDLKQHGLSTVHLKAEFGGPKFASSDAGARAGPEEGYGFMTFVAERAFQSEAEEKSNIVDFGEKLQEIRAPVIAVWDYLGGQFWVADVRDRGVFDLGKWDGLRPVPFSGAAGTSKAAGRDAQADDFRQEDLYPCFPSVVWGGDENGVSDKPEQLHVLFSCYWIREMPVGLGACVNRPTAPFLLHWKLVVGAGAPTSSPRPTANGTLKSAGGKNTAKNLADTPAEDSSLDISPLAFGTETTADALRWVLCPRPSDVRGLGQFAFVGAGQHAITHSTEMQIYLASTVVDASDTGSLSIGASAGSIDKDFVVHAVPGATVQGYHAHLSKTTLLDSSHLLYYTVYQNTELVVLHDLTTGNKRPLVPEKYLQSDTESIEEVAGHGLPAVSLLCAGSGAGGGYAVLLVERWLDGPEVWLYLLASDEWVALVAENLWEVVGAPPPSVGASGLLGAGGGIGAGGTRSSGYVLDLPHIAPSGVASAEPVGALLLPAPKSFFVSRSADGAADGQMEKCQDALEFNYRWASQLVFSPLSSVSPQHADEKAEWFKNFPSAGIAEKIAAVYGAGANGPTTTANVSPGDDTDNEKPKNGFSPSSGIVGSSSSGQYEEPFGPFQGLVVFLHGGPHGASTPKFSPMIRALVESGWAVFFPNYIGSCGFGKKHMEALIGNAGILDVADCESWTIQIAGALKQVWGAGRGGTSAGWVGGSRSPGGGPAARRVSSKSPPSTPTSPGGRGKSPVTRKPKKFADSLPVVLTGGSHGGFLTAHLIGSPTKLSLCSSKNGCDVLAGIMRNPVTNLEAMSSQTEIPDWIFCEALKRRDTRAVLHFSSEDSLKLRELSPVTNIANVDCDVLMLLGSFDLRVPPGPNGQAYVPLLRRINTGKIRGGEMVVEMELYEGEGHGWVAEKYVARANLSTLEFIVGAMERRRKRREGTEEQQGRNKGRASSGAVGNGAV